MRKRYISEIIDGKVVEEQALAMLRDKRSPEDSEIHYHEYEKFVGVDGQGNKFYDEVKCNEKCTTASELIEKQKAKQAEWDEKKKELS